MPDKDGKLTEADYKLVTDWLEKFSALATPCPLCGSMNWLIGPHLVQPITIGGDQTLLFGGGVGYPHILLMSDKCGYTIMLNAVLVGLAKAAPVPSPTQATAG